MQILEALENQPTALEIILCKKLAAVGIDMFKARPAHIPSNARAVPVDYIWHWCILDTDETWVVPLK